MTPESPVNAGHSYANAAEEFEDREEWSKALEAHKKAADQFLKAVEYTQDPVACKTLKLLATDHLRKVKELERKVLKGRISSQVYRPYDIEGLRHALPERSNNSKPIAASALGTATPAIGGSYAVLPSSSEEEEEEDPFNKFWHVVETLVDKLSNPVAFASAPLNEDDKPTPQWPAPPSSSSSAAAAALPTVTVTDDEAAMLQSYFVVPEQQSSNGGGNGSSRSSHDYAAENEQLKKQIAQLTKKIHALEKAAEESNILKSSILQFRDDVQKHAKRIMQSHDSNAMRASAAVLGGVGGSGYQNADLLARIRELEEENQQLRMQGEKQQALMNKYRERWEKLKENAKKRRAQPEQQTSSSGGVTQLASLCASEYSRQPTLLRSLAQQSTTSPSSSSTAFARFSSRRCSSMPGDQDRKLTNNNK